MDSIKRLANCCRYTVYFFGCFHGKTDAVVCIQSCCCHVVSLWQSISHATKIHNMYRGAFHSRFALRHLVLQTFTSWRWDSDTEITKLCPGVGDTWLMWNLLFFHHQPLYPASDRALGFNTPTIWQTGLQKHINSYKSYRCAVFHWKCVLEMWKCSNISCFCSYLCIFKWPGDSNDSNIPILCSPRLRLVKGRLRSIVEVVQVWIQMLHLTSPQRNGCFQNGKKLDELQEMFLKETNKKPEDSRWESDCNRKISIQKTG